MIRLQDMVFMWFLSQVHHCKLMSCHSYGVKNIIPKWSKWKHSEMNYVILNNNNQINKSCLSLHPQTFCHIAFGHVSRLFNLYLTPPSNTMFNKSKLISPWCLGVVTLRAWLTSEIGPGIHVTNSLSTNSWNLIICFALRLILGMKWSHKFAHIPTNGLSWHIPNCDLIRSLFYTQKRNEYCRIGIISL